MIIDAWAQHPTLRHMSDPIFDSLRRWTNTEAPTEELPVAATLAMMDAGKVDRSLISAWVAPRNVMISNDEVAFVTNPASFGEDSSLLGAGELALSAVLRDPASVPVLDQTSTTTEPSA